MAFKLDGRMVLVTGGTRGIGRQLTRQLIQRGVRRVAVMARDEAELTIMSEELGDTIAPFPCDLADRGTLDQTLAKIRSELPDLSLVINNAAVQTLTEIAGASDDEADQLITQLRRETALNWDAVIALSIGLLPLLSRQTDAALVNVTTGLVLAPKQSSPVYCGAKAGVSAFTRALRYQCEAKSPHVRVIEALPALVDTEMTEGRGRGKMSAEDCASQILDGIKKGKPMIDVGKTRLLRAIMRLAPALGYRIMRNG